MVQNRCYAFDNELRGVGIAVVAFEVTYWYNDESGQRQEFTTSEYEIYTVGWNPTPAILPHDGPAYYGDAQDGFFVAEGGLSITPWTKDEYSNPDKTTVYWNAPVGSPSLLDGRLHGGNPFQVLAGSQEGSAILRKAESKILGKGTALAINGRKTQGMPDYQIVGEQHLWERSRNEAGQPIGDYMQHNLAAALPKKGETEIWSDINAVDINNAGMIAATATHTALGKRVIFLLPVEITKIWSDQFPGSDANQLPNKPAPSHVGSGAAKHEYILVGGRNPGQHVYIKAKVEFPDVPDLKAKFKFALARMSGDVPFIKGPSATIDENGELLVQTSQIDAVSYSSNDPPQDYAIVGGYDANGDGLANSEVGYISKYRIRPVSFSAYDGNRAWLSAYVIGGWIVNRPFSAEFLQAFRTGNTMSGIGGSVVNETMSIEDEDQPDHHVGIAFNSSNSGPIRRYVWSQYSMLAYEIAASQAVTGRIGPRLASSVIRSEVQSYVWQTGEFQKTFTWTLHPTENDVLLDFPEEDLHTSFGSAWLKNAQIKVTVDKDTLTATSVVVQGTLTDLYDWNYEEGFETDRRAATVQAGYNTLGPGGWIFRLQVDMDTASPLPSPSYNFN